MQITPYHNHRGDEQARREHEDAIVRTMTMLLAGLVVLAVLGIVGVLAAY